LEVVSPVRRRAKVLTVRGNRVAVEADNNFTPGGATSKWNEIWSVETFEVPYLHVGPDGMETSWVPETHLIVVEESRPPVLRDASPLIPLCPKTQTYLDELGKRFRPELSIVRALPMEVEEDAVRIGGAEEIHVDEASEDSPTVAEAHAKGPEASIPQKRKGPGRPRRQASGEARISAAS